MTNREKKIFNIAREVASFSDFKGPHIGAVVVVGKSWHAPSAYFQASWVVGLVKSLDAMSPCAYP